MRALILITVAVGQDEKVRDEISKLEQVKDVIMVYGTYDVVATVEVEDTEELREVTDQMRETQELRSTLTLIQVE